ncbi:phage holin family protein [Nonlabens ponticola]|uniref:Phage holin family protein n=1 Tax=Nonlabens ponticola TaxID=2496866 RepID=A0A3S9MVC6_9FLAO|nr:phage holin family protein [Nonlabens ponticola]AZQ43146.1 hypothetical protein EJ995_02440 [Nonlabens ponticola]
MGKGIKDNFEEFTSTAQDYIESSIAYYQLDFYKKSMKGIIDGVHKIILAFFLLIALLFLSVALSIYIGNAVDSLPLGYLIVGAIYLVIMVICAIVLKPILTKIILTRTSQSFFNSPKDITIDEPEDVH